MKGAIREVANAIREVANAIREVANAIREVANAVGMWKGVAAGRVCPILSP